MQYAFFFDDFQPGVLREGRVHSIAPLVADAGAHTPQEALEYIIANDRLLRPSIEELVARGDGLEVASVRLRPPVPRPAQLLCAFANYAEDGARNEVPLDLFLKSPASVIGPGDIVELPPVAATIFHHEAELACVIGRRASKVSAGAAMDCVFGYLPFIDVSARGTGGRTMFQGKSYDTFGPLGPALVTADEVPDPHALRVQLSVSGQPRQDYNTSDMANKLPQLIEFASHVVTLEPGDVIATGTNHQGLGPLQDGDEVELTIERLGTLCVRVHDPQRRSWSREIDQGMARMVREMGGGQGQGQQGAATGATAASRRN
jgi:2-keto-4-pentenoate hydratase/2-oxohepta-3-ene-1,7-dioic acid hydratase in catechol pathway